MKFMEKVSIIRPKLKSYKDTYSFTLFSVYYFSDIKSVNITVCNIGIVIRL